MSRLKKQFRTQEPMLNTMRMLMAGARPLELGGRQVMIVPESLYDYSPPEEKDIAAYVGTAEMLCPACVRGTYAQDGETAEQALYRVARELGVDRSDERNYDSSQLPAPIALDELDRPESCGGCLKYFGLDPADFRRCPDDGCRDFVPGTEGPGTCVNCGHEYDDEDFESEG